MGNNKSKELEMMVRKLDKPEERICDVARDILEIVIDASYKTIYEYIRIKRIGYPSQLEYQKSIKKKKELL